MAFYSTQRAVSDGTLVLLPISIEYFDRSEITVYFDDLLVDEGFGWSWVGSTDKTLAFSPAVLDGVEVKVVRTTDISLVRHVFVDGAAFLDETLDENYKQMLHIAQEARERASIADMFSDLNMHGYHIINVGTATEPHHAISLAQYQADALGAFTAKNQAVAAKDAAVVAQVAAELAEAHAELAEVNAETAETNAVTARNAAVAAQVAAELAETNAELAEVNAETAATSAASSASNAADSAAEAATYVADQTGNAGKFLTTDGTQVSWAAVDALPSQTGNAGEYLTTDGTNASWAPLDTDANSTTKGLYEHSNTINVAYSITSGNNAVSAGPVTIGSSGSVTIPSGSNWVIV